MRTGPGLYQPMNLDDTTANKIKGLFKLPILNVEYNGVYYDGSICFLIGKKDKAGDWIYGIAIYINENFQIQKIKRISVSTYTGRRNDKFERVTVPIYK